jgi:uncharacterized protein YyaL (SSP411 family)
MKKFTNHLINETSAYLLQHAHNPVNWFPWSDEALKKAKEEDKPILVSIGYSACHWCHVMERESFEDEETAAIMNSKFINIKIDREERPDLDHIYMDAVQTITGSGGWPLNVFLTPDLKPFYGGTYYPPVPAFNRSSWKQVITAVADAYQTKKNEIEEQAHNLTEHLLNTNEFGRINTETNNWNNESLNIIADNLLKNADKEWGGFGNAPKFPQTFSLLFLLRHFYFTGDEAALKQATVSLDKMMKGGMYDHVGGGFARYSTDKRWQIPHFEKMLYDNALLIDVYTEVYQLTQKKEYADVVSETIQFIKNEMTSAEGGFYSALDADSEGEEGKYYTWSKKEIDELLDKDSEIFCSVYDIKQSGNWEHTNILWMPGNLETVTSDFNINKNVLHDLLKRCKGILFEARQKRVRPLLDRKVILSWNALMIKSLCKAYAAFGDEAYLNMAEKNIQFIEKNLLAENETYHSWNKTLNKQPAFLDDYAALIQAYIFMSQSTTNNEYLVKAKMLTQKVIENFSDEENVSFYFTPAKQTDVIIRKKEMYDGATPSGNALIVENLFMLSLYFDIAEWKSRAAKMLQGIAGIMQKHPLSFGYWALCLQGFINGFKEIVITGKEYLSLTKEILQQYIPVKIVQSCGKEDNNWPLLRGKNFSNGTYIYLCEDYKCLNPVKTIKEFEKLVNQNIFNKKSQTTK